MESDFNSLQDTSHLIISQNSVDCLPGKYPNKFSYFWNQTVHDLDRTDYATKVSRVVKSIKERITSMSIHHNHSSNNFKPSGRSRLTSSMSKNSFKTISDTQKNQFSRGSKRISLRSKLEEIEKKPIFFKFQKPEPYNEVNLFDDKNVLSELTLSKIRDFHSKVGKLRESLNHFGDKLITPSNPGFKKSRAIKKFRVTQYFDNRLQVNRKLKRGQNTIV